MSENELIAVLRLQRIPNIGDVIAKKLLDRCGSATAVFNEKLQNLLQIEGIGTITLKGLNDTEYLREAEAEYRFISDNKIRHSYFLDSDYPTRLKHCIDGPILLFQSGNIDVKDRKIVSVVGTRNITSYGQAFCEQFIEDIAPLKLTTH